MKSYIITILASILVLSACGKEEKKSEKTSDDIINDSIASLEEKALSSNTSQLAVALSSNNSEKKESAFDMKWEDYVKNWNDVVSELIEVQPNLGNQLMLIGSLNKAEKIKTTDGIVYKVSLTNYTDLVVTTDKTSGIITAIDYASVYNSKDSNFYEIDDNSLVMVTAVFHSADSEIDADELLTLVDENYEEDEDGVGATMQFHERGIFYTLASGENDKGAYGMIASISR